MLIRMESLNHKNRQVVALIPGCIINEFQLETCLHYKDNGDTYTCMNRSPLARLKF